METAVHQADRATLAQQAAVLVWCRAFSMPTKYLRQREALEVLDLGPVPEVEAAVRAVRAVPEMSLRYSESRLLRLHLAALAGPDQQARRVHPLWVP